MRQPYFYETESYNAPPRGRPQGPRVERRRAREDLGRGKLPMEDGETRRVPVGKPSVGEMGRRARTLGRRLRAAGERGGAMGRLATAAFCPGGFRGHGNLGLDPRGPESSRSLGPPGGCGAQGWIPWREAGFDPGPKLSVGWCRVGGCVRRSAGSLGFPGGHRASRGGAS